MQNEKNKGAEQTAMGEALTKAILDFEKNKEKKKNGTTKRKQ